VKKKKKTVVDHIDNRGLEKIRKKIKFKDELKFLLKLLKKFALSEEDGCFEN
jgi:hypothetical protein